MSILRIVCGPSDIDVGGYAWNTTLEDVFDPKRVEGSFQIAVNASMTIPHDAPAATETWYHFRYAQQSNSGFIDDKFISITDDNSNEVAQMSYNDGQIRMSVNGDTISTTGQQGLAINTAYSIDLHVIVAATITCRWYINGALYGEETVPNTGGKGVGRTLTFLNSDGNQTYNVSEMTIADEDTRGMRIREMRPKSFGIFQEWDGSINALRDTDRATGISTDTAARRVSFGVTNIEHIQPGDVINRVVSQTYAQKGETGLSTFTHFFRHKNGNVSDGADQTLAILGAQYLEEFLVNPDTGVAWEPEDFGSLQTGLQSKA